MKFRKHILKLILLLISIIPSNVTGQEFGNVVGKITDALTGDPLPGANIILPGTSIGAASDMEGKFIVQNVPTGEQTFRITYIGYKPKSELVQVVEGLSTYIEVSLNLDIIEGEEVIVSVQAQGQREAINQQISSNTSKNVISAKKIQELPEANAAEAIGRMPGVALQREGGEGNKVVIRGLSPRYSKVQIEGISMAATGSDDRSTDLSMISQYMLGGIELTKAATANQEADQLGGTVNFKLKGASKLPSFSVLTQGGFNGLADEFNDYKFVLNGSSRFFDDKLGVIGTLDIERRNRSDQSSTAGYELQDSFTIANRVTYSDISRVNERFGASLVLDYELENTNLKIFSMYNSVDTDVELLREIIDPGNIGNTAREHRFTAIDSSNTLSSMANSFSIDHRIGDWKIDGTFSYSFAKREMPDALRLDGVEESAFTDASFQYEDLQSLNGRRGYTVDGDRGYLHPSEFKTVVNKDLQNLFVDWIYDSESENFEENYSAKFDIEWKTNIAKGINLELQFGGNYKHKDREYSFESFEHAMWWSQIDPVREDWAAFFAGSSYLDGYLPSNTRFPYGVFIDGDYDGSDFLDGEYELANVPDITVVKKMLNRVDRNAEQNAFGMVRNHNASVPFDYSGSEDYIAAYINPVFKIGENLTIIPGFRYENNETEYGGIRAQPLGQWDDPIIYDSVVTKRSNDYFLPMIHSRYDIAKGIDIRASYTQTLSRPSYNLIIPSWQEIVGGGLNWNNPNLKPIESENYDFMISMYGNKIGLLTFGGFYKNISNFIYNQNTYIVEESQIIDDYPEDVVKIGGTVNGFINNPNDATLYGAEVEWQSNFWFLPGILKGIVFSFNYTYTHSELTYPLISPETIKTPFGGDLLVGSIDKSYEDRLIDQPDHLINIMLGFDYKGFSIRGSMRWKSDIFRRTHFFAQLRQSTESVTFYDLSIKQELPVDGLRIFTNISNLTEEIDVTKNRGTDWYSSKEFYGLTAELGLRFDF